MESDSQEPRRLFNQISLRQILLLTTLAALVATILKGFSFHSNAISAFLLAPTILYASLRIAGVLIRPAARMGRQPALLLGSGVIIFLVTWLVRSLPTMLVLIPVATLWVLQIGIANAIERTLNSDGDPKTTLRWRRGEWLLIGLCLFLAMCSVGIRVFTTMNHVSGKGSVLDSYWMVTLAEKSTQYDWQTGYGEEPWRCWSAPGRKVSGRTHPDWSLLRLQQFQINPQRSAVHVPYAWIVFLALIFPVTWFKVIRHL